MRHLVAAVAILGSVAQAQSIESRVAAARGSVSFEYETRASVCGDSTSITVSNDSSEGWTRRSRRSGINIGRRRSGRSERCEQGPAQVLLRHDRANVTEVRVWVGGSPANGETNLGEVPADQAARYLLAIAPRLGRESAEDAVLGSQIADGVVTWPRLLEIARDNDANESARRSAVFWVSHAAGIAASKGLDSIATDDDVTLSVRSDAVFFLAQRPHGEGIPALVRVVESSRSIKLRKDAIFYLAQTRDKRALELFERLLAGK